MKKIIQYILLLSIITTPFVSYALFSVTPTETTTTSPTNTTTQTNTNTTTTTTTPPTNTTTINSTSCIGELRTNLADAEACAQLAEQEGAALGYTIDCQVERSGLAGFIDPTSGQDYVLNTVCSVNGSTYQYGAYNLAGYTALPQCTTAQIQAITASGSSNTASTLGCSTAIVTNVNSGWGTLQTELAYQNAYNQCGGSVYYVNGAYSCTAPAGTPPATPPATTKLAPTTGSQVARQMQQTIFTSIQLAVQNLLRDFSTYTQNTLGFPVVNTGTISGATNSQCFVFTQNLSYNDTGSDVRALTYALKQENLLPDMVSIFDSNVVVAVKKFQELHTTEILSPLGLTQGTGVVGEKTRNYLNSQCLVPSYIVANPTTTTTTTTSTPTQNTCAATASVTAQKTGVYSYTFSKNEDGTYKVQLNNPAYGVIGDKYYVQANFVLNTLNALDLNRQNQGWFNYLSNLPGTPEGNTFYQNMFGSYNNAYYDWDNVTAQLNAKIGTCATTTATSTTSIPTTQQVSNTVRYIKVSVNDWSVLPLGLREITVFGPNNIIIRPTTISATDFNALAYTVPANLNDGNENTIWMANKTSGQDLQVITYDLGQVVAVEKVKVMNYGLTDTRVFVIEVSSNGSSYQQIAEVRTQVNAPIADKGIVWGMMSALSTVGPLLY